MNTWSVWTVVDGASVIIASNLPERQAREIVKNLRLHYHDFRAVVKEGR